MVAVFFCSTRPSFSAVRESFFLTDARSEDLFQHHGVRLSPTGRVGLVWRRPGTPRAHRSETVLLRVCRLQRVRQAAVLGEFEVAGH